MNNQYLEPDEIKYKMTDWSSFIFILKYIKPFWKEYVISIVLLIINAIVVFISARCLGVLIDDGLINRDWNYSILLSFIVVGLELFVIIIQWQGRKIISNAATKSLLEIRKSIFEHIHHLPMKYYDKQPQGRIVTRMTHDVEGIEGFLTDSLGIFLHSFFTFFVAIGVMFMTDAKLGTWLILSVFPLILLTIFSKGMLKNLNRQVSVTNSNCNAKLSELIDGISVIRTFGLEDWSKNHYDLMIGNHTENQLKIESFYTWVSPLIHFLGFFPFIVLFYFGGLSILTGILSVGLFITFIRYCERFTSSLITLMDQVHTIQSAFTLLERIEEFLKAKDENFEIGDDGQLIPAFLRGSIQFKKLTMSYDGQTDVLKAINFSIAPGEIIGLVGETGSGKTTIVSLLSRLYPFQEGDILIDGNSIKSYQRNKLRSLLGFVSQDVVICKGTLRLNLTCGCEISDKAILYGCEQTGLSKIMAKNSLGLDSLLFENGANLSVGEKQLVSFTRILLKNPSILILDEATANIDPYCEELIHQAVVQVMERRTCIIIAHRLNTLKMCSRLLVFRNGKLVENGHYSDLVRKKGYFYQLHDNSK